MDFDEIVEQQGWDDLAMIQILRSFVSLAGLGDDLNQFAQERANDENNITLEP